MNVRVSRGTAWVLIVLVTGFWLFFGIASAAGEHLGPVNWMLHALMPGGLFVLTAVVAWRLPLVGAVLLILEGAIVAIGYPILVHGHFPLRTIVFVVATMAVPPLAAGLLLLKGCRPAEHAA